MTHHPCPHAKSSTHAARPPAHQALHSETGHTAERTTVAYALQRCARVYFRLGQGCFKAGQAKNTYGTGCKCQQIDRGVGGRAVAARLLTAR